MKIRADQIAYALQNKHTEDAFFTQVKNGPTYTSNNLLIMDAVAVKKSWTKPCITAYEIKVSRNDFMRDEKWIYYRDYCHRMYFACPTGLIVPEELPDDTGLIWYNPEKESLYTRKKALFRDIELPAEMLYYLVICRLDSERHPYFSDKREMMEAWLDEKVSTRALGRRVSTNLIERLRDAEKKAKDAEEDMLLNQKEKERYQAIIKVLEDFGIRTWGDQAEAVKKALRAKIPSGAEGLIRNIATSADRLREMISGGEVDEHQDRVG